MEGQCIETKLCKTLAAIRTIQTNWGRMKHRTPLIRQRKACIKIQKLSRHFLFKSRRIKSVTAISGVRRMLLCRRFYLRRRRNIIKRQAIFRGYLTRKKLIISRFKKLLNYVNSCLTFGKNWINLCCIEASFGYSLEVKTQCSV